MTDSDETNMENNMPEDIKIESNDELSKEAEQKQPTKDRRNGKEEKSRKRDDRSMELVLKSLSGLVTPEEKLSAICKKYVEVNDENRKLQAALKQSEKQILSILKEKDQCQSEKSKAVLARSRLENLCRELQRQNKAVKEESLLKIREEEEKRKEVSAKFQSTLAEITALMAETNEKNVKLHEDNIEIHKKFKSVFDEMDIREQHFEGMHQMMKQELKVAEAKLAKVTLEMTQDKEILLKERNQLLLKLAEYQSKIYELQTIEANLRSQVELYTDKYDEFQNALSKSNEVFGGFNEEMEKMSKKILKLEKETNMWKSRWEKSQNALLEMATDKQTRDIEIANVNKKCSLLQELCKAFQQERTTLLAQLKESTGKLNPDAKNNLEDNQKLIESIENTSENPTFNGSSPLEEISSEIEKETKDFKTESNVTVTKVDEVVREKSKLVSDSELNVSDKTAENSVEAVNRNNEQIVIDNVCKETNECVRLVEVTNKVTQENILNSKEQKVQVPNNVTEVDKIEITSLNCEQSIKPIGNDSSSVILNVADSIKESKSNEGQNKLEASVISEIKPKEGNQIENNVSAAISHQDNSSESTKKNKDGKKKKNK